MTRLLEQAVKAVSALPDEVQDEVARMFLEFAGIKQPPIQLTPEEDADLAEADTPRSSEASWRRTTKSAPCGRSMTFEASLTTRAKAQITATLDYVAERSRKARFVFAIA